MGEVINLKRLRKIKARTEAEAEAATNRAAHGRGKAEKKLSKAERELAARKLDGIKHGDGKHIDNKPIGRTGPRQQGRSLDDE